MKPNAKLLLVGCGKMGGALLQSASEQIEACVVDPSGKPASFQTTAHVTWVLNADKIDPAFQPDIVVLAVKPQLMATTLPAYASYKKAVFLSIAAGITITSLESLLKGSSYSIVRSMPNLPASIGQGMTVATANQNVSAEQRTLCDAFLKCVGKTAWLEDEHLLDAVTALSGSGPAYLFALCEAMTSAGITLGLTPQLSEQLARQTLIGSGNLLAQTTESAESLRHSVTSPHGTTEAALTQLLAKNGLSDLMIKTMTAAAQRAKELARLA